MTFVKPTLSFYYSLNTRLTKVFLDNNSDELNWNNILNNIEERTNKFYFFGINEEYLQNLKYKEIYSNSFNIPSPSTYDFDKENIIFITRREVQTEDFVFTIEF